MVTQEQLNAILETITNVVWSISAATYETLYLNPAAEKIYGRPAAAFYKAPGLFLNIVHPEDRKRVAGMLPELLERGSATIQYRIVRPDGEVRWLEDRMAVAFGPDGNPERIDGVASDVTERLATEEKLSAILGTITNVVWSICAVTYETLYLNPAAEKIYGHPAATFYKDPGLFLNIVHPEDRQRVAGILPELLEKGSATIQYRIVRPDGEVRWLEDRMAVVRGPDGIATRFDGVAADITERLAGEKMLTAILGTITNVVWSISADTYETLYLNPAAEKIYGHPAGAFYKDPELFLKIVHPEDRQRVAGMLPSLTETGYATIQYRILTPDGTMRWLEDKVVVARGPDGKPIRYNGVANDITEQKEHEELLHTASHDALTGLPNRSLFRDRLIQAMARADRNQRMLALMFCDLDHFKEVNDTLGHEAGDQLLKEVATRLKQSLRAADTIARLGGDEFTVIVEDIRHAEDAAVVGQKVVDVLAPSIVIQEREFFVTPSVGISLYPVDAQDDVKLIKKADAAMYHVKRHGRNNYKLYSPDLDTQAHAPT